MQKFSSLLVLRLAFQSLGVVYGDLGTSPLYVFYNTFPRGIDDPEDILGALSLIIYSLTLVPLLKYVFVVLRANDNGQGELWWMNFVSSGAGSFWWNWNEILSTMDFWMKFGVSRCWNVSGKCMSSFLCLNKMMPDYSHCVSCVIQEHAWVFSSMHFF